jgi:hypothetical protein
MVGVVMTVQFKEDGSVVDSPVNSIAYEFSEGGDSVRGKPYLWDALKFFVWYKIKHFPDISHFTQARVYREMDIWLQVNEAKSVQEATDLIKRQKSKRL